MIFLQYFSSEIFMIVVFILVLLFFGLVGISSSFKRKKNTKDYLLAGQNVKPWLVALSAVATNNSGYMFIGMIGYTYTVGLESIWLMVGWILGDFIASLFVYGKLREYSSTYKLISFGSLLSNNKGTNYRIIQLFAGIVSLFFLSLYASAQFNAAGKALYATMGWHNYIGISVGGLLVLVYCFSGGIRAAIWTDAAQSIVMIVSMGLLLVYAIIDQGGVVESINKLEKVSDSYLSIVNQEKVLHSALLFNLGWLFAGFGVIGQPHIMVRYMTLDNPDNIGRVRYYYYSWFTTFYAISIGVGLFSRIVLDSSIPFDSELALPMMSLQLLPEFMVGIILAGIFAATISTADSLIISCTTALSNDIFPKLKYKYTQNKLITIFIILFASIVAMISKSGVFQIVIYAWAVLGSVFGPLISLRMMGVSVNKVTSALMMVVSGIVTIFWSQLGLDSIVYEMMPGIIVGYLIYILSRIYLHILNRGN